MPRTPEVWLIGFCPQHCSKGTTKSTVSGPEVPTPTPWWWVELWYDERKLFKELVKHFVEFVGLFGTFEIVYWIFRNSHLDPARLFMLDEFHFWIGMLCLAILALRFIIKVVLLEFESRK